MNSRLLWYFFPPCWSRRDFLPLQIIVWGAEVDDGDHEESSRIVVNSSVTKTSWLERWSRVCRLGPAHRTKRTLQRLGSTRPNTDTSHLPSIYKSLPTVTVIAALNLLPCICNRRASQNTRGPNTAERASAPSWVEERKKNVRFLWFFFYLL